MTVVNGFSWRGRRNIHLTDTFSPASLSPCCQCRTRKPPFRLVTTRAVLAKNCLWELKEPYFPRRGLFEHWRSKTRLNACVSDERKIPINSRDHATRKTTEVWRGSRGNKLGEIGRLQLFEIIPIKRPPTPGLRRTTQVFPALHCYTGRLVTVGAVQGTGDPQTLPDQIALFPQLFSLGPTR